MMNYLKFLLFPFALVYWIITFFRNSLYDRSILHSTEYDIPIIGVGNLSMGGTGKTPHVEYLIRLLENTAKPSTLSRGYKRTSKGFILADEHATATSIGDEPFQYHFKFPNIPVAVAENRVFGVAELLAICQDIQVVLLDDVFQHRAIKPGLQIMITDYQQLFTKDFLIPIGRLRESRNGANRADIIVVSKCPNSLAVEEQQQLKQEIKRYSNASVCFSQITYGTPYSFFPKWNKSVSENMLSTQKKVILLAGIAYPKGLQDHLTLAGFEIIPFIFSDHYQYQLDDLERIKRVLLQQGFTLDAIQLMTTEKDAMRLIPYIEWFDNNQIDLWVQPVEVLFNNQDFDNKVLTYYANNCAQDV